MSDYLSRVQAHICQLGRTCRDLTLVGHATLFVACAHRAPERDAAFREIQVHEATLARAEAKLADAPCREARAQTHELCSARSALCGVSAELHDADATARCLRAGDVCSGAHEHVLARCATDPPP